MPAKFNILIDRNFEVHFRRWWWALAEIIFMILCFTIIVCNPTQERSKSNVEDIRNKKWTTTETTIYVYLDYRNSFEDWTLLYLEDQAHIGKYMKLMSDRDRIKTKNVSKENEMEIDIKDNVDTYLCGVVYNGPDVGDEEYVDFHLRMRFPFNFRTIDNQKRDQQNYWDFRSSGHIKEHEDKAISKKDYGIYTREGFTGLQILLFASWFDSAKITVGGHAPIIKMGWFSFPKEHKIMRTLDSPGLVPFLYNFVFLLSFLNTVYLYARHCEVDLLAHQWRYGYNYSTHWLANSVITLFKLFVLDFIIVACLYIPRSYVPEYILFQHVNVAYFIFFMLLYNLQYLVCAIFYALTMAHGRKAVLVTLVIWFATYGSFTVLMQGNYDISNFVIIILLISHFNNAFPFGMFYLYAYSDMHKSDFWILTGCMLANVVLYVFLISWIQYLRPGHYMQVYKFDPFYLRSLCRKKKKLKSTTYLNKQIMLTEKIPTWRNFEYGPLGVEGFVKLRNICTNYKLFTDRHHLKNISLTMFKSEITVILGHHSSGKTSLISILAGWQKPNLGYVKFNGLDMHENWAKVRSLCDVCMPNNALLDCLTVKSTLIYFIRMKQQTEDHALVEAETRRWLDVLKPIIRQPNKMVRNLNFDQKRLLCLCVTLSCGTEIILLDEPTLYMRIEEKHFYWNILRAEKQDRVIILTSFSADEANFIADRIAMLDNGMLMAYGTPFFLKTQFSDSYFLVIIKYLPAPIVPITKFVEKYVPQLVIEHAVGERLVYRIPSEKRPIYQLMLINLEKESETLGIRKIFVFTSSIHDITTTLIKDKVQKFEPTTADVRLERESGIDKTFKLQGQAMIFKKMINQMPHILPASMILLTIIITLIIGHLSVVLPTPSAKHEEISLGMDKDLTSRANLPKWIEADSDCKFILVKYVEKDKRARVYISSKYYYKPDSYECGKVDFRTFLKQSESPKHKFGAIVYTGNDFEIWVNKRELHSEPVMVNLVHNIILERYQPDNKSYMSKTTNAPTLMDVKKKTEFMKLLMSHLRLPLIAGIVMPFMVSCFILALVEERYTHMWVIQRMAGLHLGVYWIITFLWDWLTYVIFAFMFLIVQLLIRIEGVGFMEKLWVFVVIIIYGATALGWVYIMSMLMKKTKTEAFLLYYVLSLISGIVAYNFYWDVLLNNNFIFYVMILSPHFAMLYAIGSIYVSAKEHDYCESMCDLYDTCTMENICVYVNDCCDLKNNDLITAVTFMILSGLLSFIGIFAINIYRAERNTITTKSIRKYKTAGFSYDDTDIKDLRMKIANLGYHDIAHKLYVVDQLEHRLPRKSGPLYTISFAVERAEAIAIYGARRSGTAHLARQLVGISPFKFGSIFVKGADIKNNVLEAWNYLAYCPANRGFYNNFTPRELLTFICMIAGVPHARAKEGMRNIFQQLNMKSFVHKKCGHLSVDKQRKVNIAVTLILYKDMVVFDSPTTGLPLATCQEIWNVLKYQMSLDRSFIFTSSEITECRVLANKMLLYERGEMLAYGGYFYLIDRFTRGVYLEIKLKRDGGTMQEMQDNFQKDIENLYRYVTWMDSQSELCSRVDNCLRFYLPVKNLQYNLLFGALEKNKHRLNIADYTINHGSIEEIILALIKSREHRAKRKR